LAGRTISLPHPRTNAVVGAGPGAMFPIQPLAPHAACAKYCNTRPRLGDGGPKRSKHYGVSLRGVRGFCNMGKRWLEAGAATGVLVTNIG